MGLIEDIIRYLVLSVLIIGFVGGFFLILDEYCMIPVLSLVLIPLFEAMNIPCHFFGNWTWFHEIFVGLGAPDWWHHWISGAVLMIGCGILLVYTFKKEDIKERLKKKRKKK